MKKLRPTPRNDNVKKVACTVSAAALMLGVSPAATVGMHFQDNYCGSATYSGFPVTLTAFGIPTNGWQNLTPMNTGYSSCALNAPPYGYTLNETISTNTSTGGLNPIPSGSLNVTWFGPTANFSDFGGYGDPPPYYNINIDDSVPTLTTGEMQVYATFLRDGINFGPPGGADNTARPGGYTVDITGLKSLFTNSPFVVELIAASDSMEVLTNAFVIDAVA